MHSPDSPEFEELIKQTDAQMERLGWTKEQGRALLVKFYNKRGRGLLTYEELDNFLLYLQLSAPDEYPMPDAPHPTPKVQRKHDTRRRN
ncbi:hypothetical protein NIES25_48580 [Nostoc linckia NIES-25]|nr:hypothetical protein NIES25_48580 [Nostoc linckia NIES-25]